MASQSIASRKRLLLTALMTQLDSESSSDEDDNFTETIVLTLKQCEQKRKRHRQQGYVRSIALMFRPDEFVTFFRLSRFSVQQLQENIVQICREECVKGITERTSTGGSLHQPLQDRLLMMLWYMASLDKYSSIADRFGVSESTANESVRRLLYFMHAYLLKRIIVWPSEAEQQEMKDTYWDLKHFPGVIGMIDGTHIAIAKPTVRGSDYYNRKDFYSLILQGVVREDCRFIDIFTGFPGKVHDARVFRHSPLYEKGMDICGDGHLLGDSAYPNLTWLLTPFRDTGRMTDTQVQFNQKHSSIRCTVERSFGLLKGRFTRLQYINQKSIETIIDTIVTACILHNICILHEDDFADVLAEHPVPQVNANAENFDMNVQQMAAIKQLNIARAL